VFKNRVLRRIFGPNRDEVTGEWRTSTSHNPIGLHGLLPVHRADNLTAIYEPIV
jgi:hypothetical protein